MKSLKTIINESASSKSDISTFVSVFKRYVQLGQSGFKKAKKLLEICLVINYDFKYNKDAYKNGIRIMKAIYDELDD